MANVAYERRVKAADRVGDHLEIKDIMTALEKRDAEIKTFSEKAAAELKDHGKVLDETKAALTKLSEGGAEVMERLQAVEQKLARRSFGGGDAKSIGAQFTELPAFKQMQETLNGTVRLEVKAGETLTSATTDAAGSVGDGIVPHRLPGIVIPGQRRFFIRDLLLNGPTSSDTIEWVVEKSFSNAAAPVAENPVSEYPKSTAQFQKKTTPVQQISHWFATSQKVLSDIPMLQNYLNGRLLYGLAYKVETQILSGTGESENLHGLLPQAVKFKESLYSQEGDSMIDTVRRSVLQTRVAEYDASFVVVNPIDYAKIETIKDKEDRYIETSIRTGGEKRLWNLAVVDTMAMPEGQFLTGAGFAAQVWARENAFVQVSTQHDDFFTRGLAAILAGERLALAVYRPDAFVHGSFELGASFDSPPDGVNT